MNTRERYLIHGAIEELIACREERRPYDHKLATTRSMYVYERERAMLESEARKAAR